MLWQKIYGEVDSTLKDGKIQAARDMEGNVN